jgi:hypothetical protein
MREAMEKDFTAEPTARRSGEGRTCPHKRSLETGRYLETVMQRSKKETDRTGESGAEVAMLHD